MAGGGAGWRQANANLKADTTEALLERKKRMHLASFQYRIHEIAEKLQARASSHGRSAASRPPASPGPRGFPVYSCLPRSQHRSTALLG